jgi:quercetin dioxygenase-like cupin family protein
MGWTPTPAPGFEPPVEKYDGAHRLRRLAMTGEASTVALGPGEGARMQSPIGGAITFKARASETGGTMTVFETFVAPGEGPPLHVHTNEDEAVYVLEGELHFRLGPDLHTLPPGAFLFIPRGSPHTFQNVGDGTARFLVIFTPSGMERFFERMAVDASNVGDQALFAAFGREVGMDVVGPPLAPPTAG